MNPLAHPMALEPVDDGPVAGRQGRPYALVDRSRAGGRRDTAEAERARVVARGDAQDHHDENG
jgi:hypothetical protein